MKNYLKTNFQLWFSKKRTLIFNNWIRIHADSGILLYDIEYNKIKEDIKIIKQDLIYMQKNIAVREKSIIIIIIITLQVGNIELLLKIN